MSDLMYICLMTLGWLFLLGWALALVTACVIAFRHENSAEANYAGDHSSSPRLPSRSAGLTQAR